MKKIFVLMIFLSGCATWPEGGPHFVKYEPYQEPDEYYEYIVSASMPMMPSPPEMPTMPTLPGLEDFAYNPIIYTQPLSAPDYSGAQIEVKPGMVRPRGYYMRNGTWVNPYIRSMPNKTQGDNWSTRGHQNPYTGKIGRRTPYR